CGAGPKTQPQTVRNHEVMADGGAVDAVHGWPPAAQSCRAFDRGRPRRGRTCGIKSGKVENALSPPGDRGIVRPSSDLAPARHAKDFAPMRLAPAVAMLLCGDDQCRSRAVAKDRMAAGQAQLRIDDDPERVVPGATPDR